MCLKLSSTDLGLTEKEVLCLAFWFFGFSDKEIALYTENSPRTIETHRFRAFKHFKNYTKIQLREHLITNGYAEIFRCLIAPYIHNNANCTGILRT